MLSKEVFVAICFIAVPVLLVTGHIWACISKKFWAGLIVPILYLPIAIWTSMEAENYPTEMIIFNVGIEGILLGVWGICRYVKSLMKKKARLKHMGES